MALHTLPAHAELEIVPGVYFAARKQHLDQLVRQTEAAADATSEPELPLKVFVGHAGWGPGQLEREIEQKAWYTLPATIEHIFAPAADLWERLLQSLDHVRLGMLLKIKHVPPDPSVN